MSVAPPARGSERVLGHVYPQSDHRAASEVDDGVDSDHFQVQLYVPGPFDGACHHQGGTDGTRLLWTEPGIPVRQGLANVRGQVSGTPKAVKQHGRRLGKAIVLRAPLVQSPKWKAG